jgi:hypothetical protein
VAVQSEIVAEQTSRIEQLQQRDDLQMRTLERYLDRIESLEGELAAASHNLREAGFDEGPGGP